MSTVASPTPPAGEQGPCPQQGERAVNPPPSTHLLTPTHYCPGCHHGIAQRLVAEAIDHYNLREKAVAISSIGCSAFIYRYLNIDILEAPHGRGPAAATGLKRARPDSFVFTYQGDGDLAAIGLAEIMHAANRGERLTVVFVNNTVYGMTGGQMAPTTLVGQKTTTTPGGRVLGDDGGPIRMAEIIGGLDGTAYAERVSLHDVKHIRAAKRALFNAFEAQLQGKGLGFVEMLSGCPTNWRMDPVAANTHIAKEMIPVFPLGVYKNALDESSTPTPPAL